MLDHVVFPLGSIDKTEVRKIAEELDLSIAHKKDSTGICFIGERHFREFLSNYLPMKPGKILNIADGKEVGRHQGVMYYTIGQRKGLDIGGIGPFFVIGKNVEKNELYVTDAAHEEYLYSDSCLITGVNWLADRELPLSCAAKFRYRQQDNPVRVAMNDDGTLTASYPETIRSVTPGQEAVIYDGDTVICGGLNGKFTYILFRNEENFYTVAKFRINDEREKVITVTGSLAEVNMDQLYNIHGSYMEHPRYGMQFRIDSYDKPLLPSGREADPLSFRYSVHRHRQKDCREDCRCDR